MSARSRFGSVLAVAAISVLATSGCAANGQFLDNPEPPPPSATPTTEQLAQPTVEPSEDAVEPDGAVGAVVTREELLAQVTDTRRCSGGRTEVKGSNGAVIRVTGSCPDIDIVSNGITVVADRVGGVTVKSSSSVVLVERADAITINGDRNVVMWTDSKPKITNRGSDNSAERGK